MHAMRLLMCLLSIFGLCVQGAHRSDTKTEDEASSNTIHNGEDWVDLETSKLGSATVRGKVIRSLSARPINAYQGLPFSDGQPKRFERATIAGAFDDDTLYDATYMRDKCAQREPIFGQKMAVAGSEDCLSLNVYVPKNADEKPLAVMLFFHGGAFTSGDSYHYFPTRLLDQDVILVVSNYRLGALSFFTTGDHRAVGNLALYDQALAMKWVQMYISDFGGNPELVTIFGQSAGSASVNYHLISEYSRGLMAGVIAESGSAIDVWALDADPVASSFALSTYVTACQSLDVQDTTTPTDDELTSLYMCMSQGDLDEIALASSKLSAADRRAGQLGFRGASPSVQGSSVPQPFLTNTPTNLLQSGAFNTDVALMNGVCAQEGSYVFGAVYADYLYPDKLDDEDYFTNQMIPDILMAIGIDDPTHALSNSLKNTYFSNTEMDTFEHITPGMIDLTGALLVKSGALETARLHSQGADNTIGTYLYSFEYEGSATTFNFLFRGSADARPPFDSGVTHTDDLIYLFNLPSGLTQTDRQTVDRMVTLWTNFAKYQNPTPSGSIAKLSIAEWSSYDSKDEYFLLMMDTFTLEQKFESRWTVTGDAAAAAVTHAPTASSQSTDEGRTWTTLEGESGITEEGATWTTMEGQSTGMTDEPWCPVYDPTYEQLQDQRKAYLITMIVFIIAFVISAAINIFYKCKS